MHDTKIKILVLKQADNILVYKNNEFLKAVKLPLKLATSNTIRIQML